MAGWNTSFLLGRPIFRVYVSFRERIYFKSWEYLRKNMGLDEIGGQLVSCPEVVAMTTNHTKKTPQKQLKWLLLWCRVHCEVVFVSCKTFCGGDDVCFLSCFSRWYDLRFLHVFVVCFVLFVVAFVCVVWFVLFWGLRICPKIHPMVSYYHTPKKFNMDTKNDGLENVSQFQ